MPDPEVDIIYPDASGFSFYPKQKRRNASRWVLVTSTLTFIYDPQSVVADWTTYILFIAKHDDMNVYYQPGQRSVDLHLPHFGMRKFHVYLQEIVQAVGTMS